MFGFDRLRWFNRDAREARHTQRLLQRLPRCAARLWVPCAQFDAHYACEMVMNADDLLARFSADSCLLWTPDLQEAAAHAALPLWLAGAKDEGELTLPEVFWPVVQPKLTALVEAGEAELLCLTCGVRSPQVSVQHIDNQRIMDWLFWTEQWLCPNGHELFREACEMHVFRRREAVDEGGESRG